MRSCLHLLKEMVPDSLHMQIMAVVAEGTCSLSASVVQIHNLQKPKNQILKMQPAQRREATMVASPLQNWGLPRHQGSGPPCCQMPYST